MNFLVVLGMHRSGTSALTGMLDAIGLSTSKHLMPANQFNERGYFEDIELKQQFDNIFHSLGRSWRDERTLPTDWQNSEPARAAQSEITHTFANTYDFNQLCVMKDPRVCRLLPLVKQVLNTLNVQPIYLFSLRTPHAVIASLAHRDAIPRSRAALLYVAYLLEAERETRGLPRAFIEYNSLLSDWQGCIRN